jgi:hypothetical protein
MNIVLSNIDYERQGQLSMFALCHHQSERYRLAKRHRRIENLVNWPVASKPVGNGTWRNAYNFGPFRNGHALAIMFNRAIVAFVSILDNRTCPTNIARLVPFIVIDSIKGKTLRAFANVFPKRMEVIFPLWAHFYAAIKVIAAAFMVRIAPFNRTSPLAVLPSLGVIGYAKPAASAQSEIEIVGKNRLFRSAVTHAQPKRFVVNASADKSNHSEASKSLADKARLGVRAGLWSSLCHGGLTFVMLWFIL